MTEPQPLLATLSERLLNLNPVYILTGILLYIFAFLTLTEPSHTSRKGTAAFWLILGSIFLFGGVLPHWVTGLLVLVMVAIDGAGRVRRGAYAGASRAVQVLEARRLGDKIFLPVLMSPLVTFGLAGAVRLAGVYAVRKNPAGRVDLVFG